MKENIIENYLRDNIIYCFNIDDYTFPRFINSRKIDLKRNRENELLKKKSSYAKNFEKELTNPGQLINNKYTKFLTYIPEFPIPIENRKLWENILKELGLPTNNKAWSINFFKLDYIFPYFDCCVEIDSSFHFPNIKYDQARDIYLLSMYGIRTIRMLNFGENKKNRSIYLNNFKQYLQERIQLSPNPSKIKLSFSKLITEEYINQNKLVFEFIEELKKQEGNKFLILKELNLNLKDYIGNYPELEHLDFKKDLIDILKVLYNKKLVLLENP